MIKIFLLFFTFPCIYGSDLDDWIKNKSELIKNNNFKVSFDYSFKDKTKMTNDYNHEDIYQYLEYYSMVEDAQLLKINSRYVLFYPDYSEIIDEQSKQKFLDKKDEDFEKMKNKLRSIFIDKDFKIIKLSKDKYLLSLNNYYLNINIIFDHDSNLIKELSFTENSHVINVNNLFISRIDSLSFNSLDWDSYQVIDLR